MNHFSNNDSSNFHQKLFSRMLCWREKNQSQIMGKTKKKELITRMEL